MELHIGVLLGLVLNPCIGFQIFQPCTDQSSPLRAEIRIHELERNGKSSSPLKHRQLWLDLRETALFPQEAIDFLQDQLGLDGDSGSFESTIDAVLVSKHVFENLDDNRRSALRQIQVLYENEDKDELIGNEPNSQQAVVLGRIITATGENDLLDPLLAMGTVLNEQKWLLLHAPLCSPDRNDQLLHLLELLSASASISLQNPDETNLEFILPNMDPPNKGGLAVACPDLASFMNLDRTLAEFSSSSLLRGTTTTESGVLIPSDTAALDERPHVTATALVLPLEIPIWKTAFDVSRYIQ